MTNSTPEIVATASSVIAATDVTVHRRGVAGGVDTLAAGGFTGAVAREPSTGANGVAVVVLSASSRSRAVW